MLDYHKYLALQSNLLSEFVMCYLWKLSSRKEKKAGCFSWDEKIIPLHRNLWFVVNLLYLQKMGKKWNAPEMSPLYFFNERLYNIFSVWLLQLSRRESRLSSIMGEAIPHPMALSSTEGPALIDSLSLWRLIPSLLWRKLMSHHQPYDSLSS